MANILIIDDDKMICDALCSAMRGMGHDAAYVLTIKDGLKEVLSEAFDVVFLDVRMPDGNGLNLLPKVREAPSSPEVIIMTGQGEPDGAELAIRSGAWDYVEKPPSVETLTLPLVRALEYREEKNAGKSPVALKREGIVGNSAQMRRCLDHVAQVANTEMNILITGKTGTGKELFAQAIHENSSRASRNFVVVDCAALPETLVESTLFGHEKGAFTGADKNHQGLVKQADRGTLFLDEVGELPLSIQRTFLRVLQERRFRQVGGKEELKSDFRLVAATNRDLHKMVQAGKFRNDLLFRIRSMVIALPLLRGRAKDIKDIAMYYMNRFCDRYGIGTKGFSPEFVDLLTAYSWPGNVRELVHAMEAALSKAQDEATLFPVHLPEQIRIELARTSVGCGKPHRACLEKSARLDKDLPNLQAMLDGTERQYLQDLVLLTKGNMKEACRVSGISRSRFYARLKQYNIHRYAEGAHTL
ncbi:MAG: sigma-54-dependent Fis family transcriptional regulator [Proteobacteria bacterium]|nr:sigma-54-dependent Fis family transcriptional regulator [Pseudomonadota bacterium]